VSEFEREVLDRLERIERNTRIAIAGEHSIVATIADLDTEIAGELTTAVNAIDLEVTTLEANIAAGTDTTKEIANIHALVTAINTTLNPAPAGTGSAAAPAAAS
jgi:hypothetical protein